MKERYSAEQRAASNFAAGTDACEFPFMTPHVWNSHLSLGILESTLDRDEVFGTVEAVKTVSDLFLPLSGEIIEFNEDLESNPESVNTDPYGAGWMIKIKISDSSQCDELLDAKAYGDLIGA